MARHDDHRFDHHPDCPCGCGELADECAGPRPNPLGSMRTTPPSGSTPRTGSTAFRTRTRRRNTR